MLNRGVLILGVAILPLFAMGMGSCPSVDKAGEAAVQASTELKEGMHEVAVSMAKLAEVEIDPVGINRLLAESDDLRQFVQNLEAEILRLKSEAGVPLITPDHRLDFKITHVVGTVRVEAWLGAAEGRPGFLNRHVYSNVLPNHPSELIGYQLSTPAAVLDRWVREMVRFPVDNAERAWDQVVHACAFGQGQAHLVDGNFGDKVRRNRESSTPTYGRRSIGLWKIGFGIPSNYLPAKSSGITA